MTVIKSQILRMSGTHGMAPGRGDGMKKGKQCIERISNEIQTTVVSRDAVSGASRYARHLKTM